MTEKQVKYEGLVCRGSMAFGSGCGRCHRCIEEISRMKFDRPKSIDEVKEYSKYEFCKHWECCFLVGGECVKKDLCMTKEFHKYLTKNGCLKEKG
jgi:hypothetical protein